MTDELLSDEMREADQDAIEAIGKNADQYGWELDPDLWDDVPLVDDEDIDNDEMFIARVPRGDDDTIGSAMTKADVDGSITISKVDERKGLVFGWATVIKKGGEVVFDREDDSIEDEWELERAAYGYVATSGNMGDNHKRVGVGRLVESMVITDDKKAALGLPLDAPTGWWVGFKIEDADVMKGFADGKYAGFSVHGKGRRIEKAMKLPGDTMTGKLSIGEEQQVSRGIGAIERYRKVADG